nr:hypothetical protein [Tanacetum cinerariifolium]
LTSLVGIRPGESLFATPDILIRVENRQSIFNIHMCSNGRWGKPTGNGSDTGVATMPKSNKKNGNGDGDGDDVEQNKLMENSMCDYDSSILMCLMENSA